MPVYVWFAQTKKGRKLKGEIDAANEAIALSQLKKTQFHGQKAQTQAQRSLRKHFFPQAQGHQQGHMVFTRQFSTMIDAGLPLVQGLTILGEQCENPLQDDPKEITKDVEEGLPGGGHEKAPQGLRFPFRKPRGRRGGGGILDTIPAPPGPVHREGGKIERPDQGAMTYPSSSWPFAILVISVILVFVIPVFEDMFKKFSESALPRQPRSS